MFFGIAKMQNMSRPPLTVPITVMVISAALAGVPREISRIEVNAMPSLSPALLNTRVAFMVLLLLHSPFATALLDLPGEPRRLSRFLQGNRSVVVGGLHCPAALRFQRHEPRGLLAFARPSQCLIRRMLVRLTAAIDRAFRCALFVFTVQVFQAQAHGGKRRACLGKRLYLALLIVRFEQLVGTRDQRLQFVVI